jgi:hypothetical protein
MKYNENFAKSLSEFIDTDFIRNDSSDKNQIIHHNQIKAGREMALKMTSFNPPNNEHDARNRHIILGAQMQMGKTGALMALINVLLKTGYGSTYFKIKKYFILTGMNDNGWVTQTKFRMLMQIIGISNDNLDCGDDDEKMYGEPTFVLLKNHEIKMTKHDLKDCMVIIDESHFGSSANSVLTNFLKRNGADWKNDSDSLRKNNIYIVSVSATPFDELHSDIAISKEIVLLEEGKNYFGLVNFFDNNQLYKADDRDFKLPKKLMGEENQYPIIDYIQDAYGRMIKDDINNVGPKGIIMIRANKRKNDIIEKNEWVQKNFRVILMNAKEMGKVNYSLLIDLVKVMKCSNEKPLLILVKGGYRAAITIEEEHKDLTYMVYDYSKQIYATPQGLVGRYCGYRTNPEFVGRTKFYVNLEHTTQYVGWIINNLCRDYTPSQMNWEEESKITPEDLSIFKLSISQGIYDENMYTKISSKLIEIYETSLTDEMVNRFKTIHSYDNPDDKRQEIAVLMRNQIIPQILEENRVSELSFNYIGELYINPGGYQQTIIKRWFNESGSSLRVDSRGHSDYLKLNGKSEKRIKDLKLTTKDVGSKYIHLVLNYDCNVLRVIHGEVVKYYRKEKDGAMIRQHKRTDLVVN